MKTICNFCVFKLVNEDGVQTGCYLNRLEKFENELVGDSYELKGICRACRNENWVFLRDNPDLSIDDLAGQTRLESECSYDVVVAYNRDDNFDDILKTVKAINELSILPNRITVVTNRDLQQAKELYINLVPHTDIKVRIELSLISDDELDLLASGAIVKTQSDYLLFCLSGCEITSEQIEKVNDAIDWPKGMTIGFFNDFYITLSRLVAEIGKVTVNIPQYILRELNKNNLKELILDETESKYTSS